MTQNILDGSATEEGSILIPYTFTNARAAAITPKSATYSITDLAGNVINFQEDLEVSPLTSSVEILLSGDDISISGIKNIYYLCTFKWIYDLDISNPDIEGTGEVKFLIRKLKGSGNLPVGDQLVFIDNLGVEFVDSLGIKFIDG